MRIRVEILFCLVTCWLVVTVSVLGQAPELITWQTIISSNNEFAITVPGNFLAHKDHWNTTNVVGGAGGTGFRIVFDKTSKADEVVKMLLAGPVLKGKRSAFSVGESQMIVNSYEGPGIYHGVVDLVTKSAHYSLSIFASSINDNVLRSVLASIRLNDQPIFKDAKISSPTATSSVNVKELQDSDLVRAALKRKQTERITSEEAPKDYMPSLVEETLYSRPGLIVSQPQAEYTSDARMHNVQGTVRLRVQLKANGNVGKILVVKGLPRGLTEEAISAASRIKFIPAEVGGKPADFAVTREYTFSIY